MPYGKKGKFTARPKQTHVIKDSQGNSQKKFALLSAFCNPLAQSAFSGLSISVTELSCDVRFECDVISISSFAGCCVFT